MGEALRLARLEQLDHARQTLGDVLTRDSSRVEGPHGQLRPGLADRLGGDDPHRVADVDHRAGRGGDPVAGAADPRLGLALQRRSHRDHLVLLERLGQLVELLGVDLLVSLQQLAAALGLELLRRQAADQVVVQRAVLLADRHLDVVLGLAVLDPHDHVLGDVDQPPRQVARVGGAQGGVGEALAGAVGRDEVLEDREPLHEVGLDRALDDLALRICHQAAHPRQLADLLERAAGPRVGHHVDRVELVEVVLHRLADHVGCLVPAAGHRLAALLLGDVAVVVLAVDLVRLRLVALEDLVLVGGRDDVVLGDRDPRLGGEVEPEVLEGVEDERDRRRSVGIDQIGDRLVDVALLQRVVDELIAAPASTPRRWRPPVPARCGR